MSTQSDKEYPQQANQHGTPNLTTHLMMLSVWIGLGALILGLNMRRGLNHDEHQFIASAALMARDGLSPYADFPYFHVPLLSIIYAWLFQFSDHLLLTTRLFSIACSWLGLWVLFDIVRCQPLPGRILPINQEFRLNPSWKKPIILLTAISATFLLFTNPLFIYTSGRAWNHDLPVLLTLMACWLYLKNPHLSLTRSLFIGILIGLSTATSLSFALIILPFAFIMLRPNRQTLMRITTLGVGALIGFTPALWMALQSPDGFLFGNLGYVRLNTQYYQEVLGHQTAMTLTGKLTYVWQLLLTEPRHIILIALFIMTLIGIAYRVIKNTALQGRSTSKEVFHKFGYQPDNPGQPLMGGLIAVLFIGAMAATPSQEQYFYAIIPFLVLWVCLNIPFQTQWRHWLLTGAATLSLLFAIPDYLPGLQVLLTPDEWSPNKIHRYSQQITALLPDETTSQDTVLTLSPIYALEAGLPIYPEFATGPFAWRVAHLMSHERRTQLHIIGANDLNQLVEGASPSVLLTSFDNDDHEQESALFDYAQRNHYTPIPLPDEGLMWLPPLAVWDNTIHLGAHTLPRIVVPTGTTINPLFYLQNRRAIDTNLNILVRVVGQDGTEIVRDEGWPWGLPTSKWVIGDVLPDGHEWMIPNDAKPGYYRVEMSFYDPDTLALLGDVSVIDYLAIGDDIKELAGSAFESPIHFGEQIELHSAELPTSPLPSGDTATIHLSWLATSPPAADYTVFAHLVGPSGLIAQQDQVPLHGFYPTGFWHPNLPVTDAYTLTIPNDTPPGQYPLYVGMYEPITGDRLVVLQDEDVIGDSFVVGLIEIK
ncbi:MAG: hypothetical protein AAF639_28210 [Chloroflexota bacterium]